MDWYRWNVPPRRCMLSRLCKPADSKRTMAARAYTGFLFRCYSDPNIYSITILDNYSRFIVGSAISRTQDQPAFLRVLLSAVTEYGAPEAVVSDGGSIFKAKRAMAIYAAL